MGNANNLIDYLRKSPVFASSLGSKELFHSNIWAYLINQNPRILKAFFCDKVDSADLDYLEKLKKGTGVVANREKLNMDLLVATENKVFVIENKIKSLPHEDQLRKYEDKIEEKYKHVKKEDRSFLLTGIRENMPSIAEGAEWDYLSYERIAAGIRKELKGCEKEHYFAFAIEYCNMIVALSALLESGINEIRRKYYFPAYVSTFTDKELLKGIEQLRVGDIFQKLNAERFVQHVQEQLIGQFSENAKGNSGYTHQNSFSEFFFERTGEPENEEDITPHVRIGVQIQETQFRWYIVTRTKKAKGAKEVFEQGKKEQWFFERIDGNQIKCPTGDEENSKMRKGKEYCLFHTTTDTFVYQYIDIEEDKCDFDTLTKLLIKFLRIADGKVDAIKKVFL